MWYHDRRYTRNIRRDAARYVLGSLRLSKRTGCGLSHIDQLTEHNPGHDRATKDRYRRIQKSGSRINMPEKAVTSGLVDRQKDAVGHTSGPLLILAGAGTGKTTTITAKIAYMVQELRVDPEQILALTFSRAAAANMRAQVEKLLNGTSEVHVSTFHSFCAGVIRDNADKCGSAEINSYSPAGENPA